jgi:hypothetical protein
LREVAVLAALLFKIGDCLSEVEYYAEIWIVLRRDRRRIASVDAEFGARREGANAAAYADAQRHVEISGGPA